MTPSLINFFWGLFWGALVLGSLFAALIVISQADKVKRRS
ncbi:MAG: photosystem II reaction center X protein [Cyanobacteria bacterium KgW148]|nr:photosystem II reaction center X protein [Cyanobacteria bacterium KgW148]